MITIELLLSEWRGWYLMIVSALTLFLFIRMGISKSFKSTVIFYGVPTIFISMIVWFMGGAFYADLWRFAKWGTWSASIPLPEFFDPASWGFAVAGFCTFALIFWIVKAQKVRTANKKINFNV